MKNTPYRILVVAAVVIVLAAAFALKARKRATRALPAAAAKNSGGETPANPAFREKALPKVIDLGRGMCIPCKMMKPILDELAKAYAGRATIEIIDIGEHPEQAERFRIRMIPTQIFINVEGKEVFRHEGFMPKEAIEAKLKEMGVK